MQLALLTTYAAFSCLLGGYSPWTFIVPFQLRRHWSDCLLFFLLHWLHLLSFSACCIHCKLVSNNWFGEANVTERRVCTCVCVSIHACTIILCFFFFFFAILYYIIVKLLLFCSCQFFHICCTYFSEVSFSIKKDLIQLTDFRHLIGFSLVFLIMWLMSVFDAVTAQLFATNRHFIHQGLWVFLSLWAEKSATSTYVTVKMSPEELLSLWCSTLRRLYPFNFASNCSYRTKCFLNLACFSCCFPFMRKLGLIFTWR